MTKGAPYFNRQRNCQAHHSRSWIFKGVRNMGSSESQSLTVKHKMEKMPFLTRCWHTLKLIPDCYSKWNLGWRQKANQGMAPFSISREEKIQNVSVMRQGHDPCLLGLWKEWFLLIQCQERKQSTLTPTTGRWQNRRRVSNEFDLTQIQQKFCFNMTMQGSTQVCSKPWQSFVRQCYPIHPTAPIKHKFPPMWSPKGWNP